MKIAVAQRTDDDLRQTSEIPDQGCCHRQHLAGLHRHTGMLTPLSLNSLITITHSRCLNAGIMPIRPCANDQKKVRATSTVTLLFGQDALLAAIQRNVQGVQEIQLRKIADELESVTCEIATDLR